MHELSDWIQPSDTDVIFTEEQSRGELNCLCSRCLLPILGENAGLRYRVKRTGCEFRYHLQCLGVELLEATSTKTWNRVAASWYSDELDEDEELEF